CDPGGPRRDRARRARLVRHRAPLGRGVAGAYMSLDAVGLEVMGHAFASIAEEMGLVLIHSAVSPNIRERRDCSAALFDAAGAMIAQAAHIPVHLGALHESVAAVRVLAPAPGDVFILNDPYAGGSHLPDITLVGAVEVDGAVGGYGVVRAHHSDVGGMQAGSMPAGARELFAEGVVVPPLRLTPEVERFLLANVRTLLPEDVPTNGGVTRVVRVTAPEGCLVHARFPSAVAAGNVETSQRIADTVFLALANGGLPVPAQGQGTMNNVTFGGLGVCDS